MERVLVYLQKERVPPKSPQQAASSAKGGLKSQTLAVGRPREMAALFPGITENAGCCWSTRSPDPTAQGYHHLLEMEATPKAMFGLV